MSRRTLPKMALRAPPGRAGRLWLLDRLAAARRGAELLERKREVLLRQRAHVAGELQESMKAWQAASAAAREWIARATLVDGAGRIDQLSRHVQGSASIELSWRNLMGAWIPSAGEVQLPEQPALSALGGSSAVVLAASAYRQATIAAARHAAAERAHAEISAELAQTSRRLQALRKRWIPQHEAALAQLELTLDESQREQAARVQRIRASANRIRASANR